MKKGKVALAIATAVVVVAASLSAVYFFGIKPNLKSGKKESSVNSDITEVTGEVTEETKKEESQQPIDDPDVITITFGVPSLCHAEDLHLTLLNDALYKDGYKYRLETKTMDYDGYSESLEKELKDGTIDVAWLGLSEAGGNMLRFYDEGLILQLDDLLFSENGKKLYDSFPKALWNFVELGGHYYGMPYSPRGKAGIYAAFNTDYISDEAIDNWDGSLQGIYDMVKGVDWKDENAPRFQYFLDSFDFDRMIGCEVINGLLYDFETKQIQNPLESEKLIGYLELLQQMKSEKIIADYVSYLGNNSQTRAEKDLEAGNFLVVLGPGAPEEFCKKANIRVKELPMVITTNLNGTIAISSKTKNVDAVIDFLGTLYSDGKYGNLLIYGEENVDYKLQDGRVVNMDGSDFSDVFFKQTSLGLCYQMHPLTYDSMTESEIADLVEWLNNGKRSPFLGFVPKLPADSKIPDDLSDFLGSLNSMTLEEAIKEYSPVLAKDGMEKYLRTAQEQWETYQKG